MTKDPLLTKFLGVLLKNRRFFVEFNTRKSRVRLQRNGLPQGSVLAPLLYNIYTNDQPQDQQTSRFIHVDDPCIINQDDCFEQVEENLTNALQQLNEYYKINSLTANLSKTHVCAFHLQNRYADKKLTISWNGERL